MYAAFITQLKSPSGTTSWRQITNYRNFSSSARSDKAIRTMDGIKDVLPWNRRPSSIEVMELDHEHGAHNYHSMPVVISRGDGVYVWDPEGRRYYDFLSAYSAVNQGHCHPRIIKTLVEQASRLTVSSRAFHSDMFGVYTEYVTRYFGYDMVLPMNTGAEAVDTAVKLARKWGYLIKKIPMDTAIVLSCTGNFHGRTMTAVSLSTETSCRYGFGPYLPNVGAICPSTSLKVEYGDADTLEQALKAHGKQVAGFIVEPIQGEAGVVIPPAGYLKRCYDLCKEHNVLFIADEIQSGLGRTGKLLASEHESIRPDVILLGKALSGGVLPISAVLADREIMLCIGPGQHGSTFGGNPLASAVAMTALQVIKDEQLVEKSASLGALLLSGLQSIHSPVIQSVRGKGLFCAIVIDETKTSAWDVCMLLKSRGMLAKPTRKNIIRLSPPLIITERELLDCLAIIKGVFRDLPSIKAREIPGYVVEDGEQ